MITQTTERKSNLLGRLFHDFDSMLTSLVLSGTNLLGWSTVVNHMVRPTVLKIFGLKFGKNCAIFPGLRIYSRLDDVVVDDHTFINQNCFFDASAPVRIGKHCQIGLNVSFITSSHRLSTNLVEKRPTLSDPIQVDDYVWICAGATILGGVHIGQGSVIAAGAIVNKDVPPNTLVGGIPAKPIKSLTTDETHSQTVVPISKGVS